MVLRGGDQRVRSGGKGKHLHPDGEPRLAAAVTVVIAGDLRPAATRAGLSVLTSTMAG